MRRKTDPYLGKLVSVQWADPCGYGGWRKAAEVDSLPGLALCTTVGSCIKHDEESLVVAGSWNNQSDWGDITFIPKVMVLNVVLLTEVA